MSCRRESVLLGCRVLDGEPQEPGSKMKIFLCSVILLVLLGSGSAGLSQTEFGGTITEIEVIGAVTVGEQQVLAWSGFEVGRTLTQEMVASGIRRLFATQKFSDIYVYRQEIPGGIRLVVNLREFPRIRTITFAGNKKVNEDKLREVFPVAIGQFANPAVLNRELEAIREVYHEKGYYHVAVHTDSSLVDQFNLEDLVVTVVEGEKVKCKRIEFAGNELLKSDDLRGAMKQGTGGFLRSATFKKQKFEEDKDRIVEYCRNHGFLDASVEDVAFTFKEEGDKRLEILITIHEGQQYFVGDFNWENNTVLDDLTIADEITLEKGDVFDESEYHETLRNLNTIYANQGYIYITVEPVREIEDNQVNVTFVFREGEPARIRNIQIVDNIKTHDSVILREMRIFPGDTFNMDRISNSQRDIFQLGFFQDVQPDFRPVADGVDVDLIMKVKEKQTGQFMFGAAYSAQTAVTGFIQVAETNFRGKGQHIGLTWQFGRRQRYVDLSFTEPWFRGTPTLLGVDIFDRYQYSFEDFYESRVRGFSLRLGRRIPGTRFSRVGLRYERSDTKLSNFSSGYISWLDNLERQVGTNQQQFERLDEVDWPRRKSAVRLTLSRNSTDNPFFPTTGSRTTYSAELSGGPLGCDIDYQEHIFSHSFYRKLPAGFALHCRALLGMIRGLEDPGYVPDYEKYRLGGNRLYPLRGYRDLEVVPAGNPSFIGGRFFSIFSTEILFPLSRAFQVLAFLDQGDTWNSFGEADFANLRKGAGFGIRVEVPFMGTIGFDYGYGFDRAGGPSWEPHFNIGQFF